jgi:hypothetical protein
VILHGPRAAEIARERRPRIRQSLALDDRAQL